MSEQEQTTPVAVSEDTKGFDAAAFDALAAELEALPKPIYDKDGNPVFTEQAEGRPREGPRPADPPETEEVVEEQDESPEQETAEGPVEFDPKDYGAVPQNAVLGENQEPMTIGQMKDELTKHREERAHFERQQHQLRVDSLLVNQILADPDSGVTEAMKQKYETINKQAIERDRATLAQLFPQWSDQNIMAADVQAMKEVASSYGVTEVEMGKITAPWLLALMKETADYRKREASAKQVVNKKVPAAVKRQANGQFAPTKQNGSRIDRFNKTLNDAMKGGIEGADFGALDSYFR